MSFQKPTAVNLELWLRSEGAGCLPANIVSDGATMGPYHVLGLLGRGGNAEVYRAVGDDGAVVALKVPRHRDDAAASNPLGEERTAVLDLSAGFHRLRFVYHHSGTGYTDQFSGVRIVSLEMAE